MTQADLRGLIVDCLSLWGVWGRCAWSGEALEVRTVSGIQVRIRPACEAERPARWMLETMAGAARPPRPAASIVGLLGALRKALGGGAAGPSLKVGAPAMAPQPPGERAAPVGRVAPAPMAGTTPVLVVTGFLGSGKTTFIRKVLSDPRFARTAVIVNEFGEIGLDHDILASSSDALIRLSTGCLCCAVRSDLIDTLLDLDARRCAGEVAFDRIIIETSGLADPVPILQALMSDPAVAARFSLGGVLTLVDAVHGASALADHVEARRQVAVADRILITKTDLMPASAGLLNDLRAANPSADKVSQHEEAISGLLAGIASARVRQVKTGSADQPAQHSAGHDSIALTREAPTPAIALALFLQSLADHAGDRLLRVKGLVLIAEMPERPALIHGVQHVFSPPEWLEEWPGGARHTRMVFIGAPIPPHWPRRLLEAICAEVRDAAEKS
ncbi:CobW family GTP-binding protein [Roseixanthobacter pseudopolyaromaticivorans]|uniref:CobW family GTP-binding protein n=1 Tax=Xanthobacteraceae TaxID=335928 RepID=UPI00372C18D6